MIGLILKTCLWLICILSTLSAKTYIPLDPKAHIQSIDITGNIADIKMPDYIVTLDLQLMKGIEFTRAHGITPQGMTIGLKYNDVLLRLIAIDQSQKNYMSIDFLIKGGEKMQLPEAYLAPISELETYISAPQFINSYSLWPADSVARGYELIPQREKGIIMIFPAISLEIADKLCRASYVTTGIFEILSDQSQLTCDDLSVLNQDKYLQALQLTAIQERDLLVDILECTQGLHKPKYCQNINKKLADQIQAAHTLKDVLYSIN